VSRVRVLAVVAVVNGLLALIALGWLAWIAADPQYWFPGAYAQKGVRGDPGPQLVAHLGWRETEP
jgi:hypothetical protein